MKVVMRRKARSVHAVLLETFTETSALCELVPDNGLLMGS
jgi:hypothetical protein